MGCLKHEALSPRVSAAFVEIQSASLRIGGPIVFMLVAETETSFSASSWCFCGVVGDVSLRSSFAMENGTEVSALKSDKDGTRTGQEVDI